MYERSNLEMFLFYLYRMLSRDSFRPGRQSIVLQPEYQEEVHQAFLRGEKPFITVKNLNISRSTYYRILSILGISIRPSLHGGNSNSFQEQNVDFSTIKSILENNPVPIGRYSEELKISPYQRRQHIKRINKET